MKNKTYQKIILFLVILLVFFIALRLFLPANSSPELPTRDPNVTITGKITDEDSALAAFDTLQKNLQAANDEDITAYVATLVSDARAETKEELLPFFKEYDLKNTLLSFEVQKQEADHLLVQTTQETKNTGKKEYKDHIATTSITFAKEDGKWLIEESVMTDTKFI